MKTLSRCLPLVLCAALAGGCQSSGTDKSASALNEFETLRKDVVALQAAVAESSTSLETLAAGQGDMAAQFKTFSKAVDQVEKKAKKTTVSGDNARIRRDEYMKSWEASLAEIQSESLREKASKRHKDAAAEFERVDAASTKQGEAFDAWMADLKDLRTYLENDLNPAGIKSVSSDIKGLTKGAEDFDKLASDSVAKLDKLLEAMKASEAQEEEAASGS